MEREREMRRLALVPLAGLLSLTIAAPAMAGPNVSNQSGSADVVEGEFFGEEGYGHVSFFDEGDGGWGDIYLESGSWVACDGAVGGDPSPKDTVPGEEPSGFVGTRTYGYAVDVDVALDGRLGGATVTATVELSTETVDECAGTYETTSAVVDVTAALSGTGDVVRSRDSGSFQVPGEYNGHSRYSSKSRSATGSVDIESLGTRTLDWAVIGSLSWSDHSNG
jgi:hypothetical protein